MFLQLLNITREVLPKIPAKIPFLYILMYRGRSGRIGEKRGLKERKWPIILIMFLANKIVVLFGRGKRDSAKYLSVV